MQPAIGFEHQYTQTHFCTNVYFFTVLRFLLRLVDVTQNLLEGTIITNCSSQFQYCACGTALVDAGNSRLLPAPASAVLIQLALALAPPALPNALLRCRVLFLCAIIGNGVEMRLLSYKKRCNGAAL